MLNSLLATEFPYLDRSDHKVTSPASNKYNSIAYAAGETFRVWWPDKYGIGYWPEGVDRVAAVEAFVEAYRTIGYAPCTDGNLEPGIQKVALYAARAENREQPTHAALKLESRCWTRELGSLEDIEHSRVEDMQGTSYGRVISYLSRPRTQRQPIVGDQFTVQQTAPD